MKTQASNPNIFQIYETMHKLGVMLRLKTVHIDKLRGVYFEREKFLADMRKMCSLRESHSSYNSKKEAVDNSIRSQNKSLKVSYNNTL